MKTVYRPCDFCGILVERVKNGGKTVCWNCKVKGDKERRLRNKLKVVE